MLLAGVVALVVVASLALPVQRLVQAAPEQVYIALGDSVAAGQVTSLPRSRSYPALVRNLLSQQAEVELRNLAVLGETAESFLADGQFERLEAELSDIREQGTDVRVVTVSLGGNEMLNLSAASEEERVEGLDVFRETFPSALDAIGTALGDVEPRIVATTYYDLTGGDPSEAGSDAWWIAQFNEVIREASSARGVLVADVEPVFRGRIRELTWHPTDIHPTNTGHAEIARIVWQVLEIDQEPPTVTIERPDGDMASRLTPTIRVVADDNVGIDHVELWIDGTYERDLIYLPAEAAWMVLWDGRDYPDESVTLSVRAADLAGNETVVERVVTMPAR